MEETQSLEMYSGAGSAPVWEKPRAREKALEYGLTALDDRELIMLLLGRGTRDMPVAALAKAVSAVIAERNREELPQALLELPGMGPGKAAAVAAALELGRRLNAHHFAAIKKPADIVPLVQHYVMQPREHFLAVLLNGAHEILRIKVISVGTVNQTLIHPREVFCDAVRERASAVILCHNHPSGTCEPSLEDIKITARLMDASEVLGISILDHIILARNNFFSMREHGAVF